MGLGSEWNDRWCVVMPRFPSVAAPANQQLTRSLLVIYKVGKVASFVAANTCSPAGCQLQHASDVLLGMLFLSQKGGLHLRPCSYENVTAKQVCRSSGCYCWAELRRGS